MLLITTLSWDEVKPSSYYGAWKGTCQTCIRDIIIILLVENAHQIEEKIQILTFVNMVVFKEATEKFVGEFSECRKEIFYRDEAIRIREN